jgi:hypothetical protein
MQNRQLNELKNKLGERHDQQLSENAFDVAIKLKAELKANKPLEDKIITKTTRSSTLAIFGGFMGIQGIAISVEKRPASAVYSETKQILKHHSHDAIEAKLKQHEEDLKNGEEISDFLANDGITSFRP